MRLGIVKISDELYSNNYDSCKVIFEHLRPLNIKFHHRQWFIKGESQFFDDVAEGDGIPQYIAEITYASGKAILAKFERVNS